MTAGVPASFAQHFCIRNVGWSQGMFKKGKLEKKFARPDLNFYGILKQDQRKRITQLEGPYIHHKYVHVS